MGSCFEGLSRVEGRVGNLSGACRYSGLGFLKEPCKLSRVCLSEVVAVSGWGWHRGWNYLGEPVEDLAIVDEDKVRQRLHPPLDLREVAEFVALLDIHLTEDHIRLRLVVTSRN